jgi:DNA-binding MarR family transcriptional regulator
MRSDPSDHVGLSLWLRLMKVHGLILREARRSVGSTLTLAQFDVLAQLWREPSGLTSGDLSRRLLVTAGNLTGIVERLGRAGLVLRTAHESDRRANLIRLTSTGRKLMGRLLPRHARDIDALLNCVPRTDLERLRSLLGRLSRGIEERTNDYPRKEAG